MVLRRVGNLQLQGVENYYESHAKYFKKTTPTNQTMKRVNQLNFKAFRGQLGSEKLEIRLNCSQRPIDVNFNNAATPASTRGRADTNPGLFSISFTSSADNIAANPLNT
ncbi:hypothetical protein HAX54_045559 [Datura stramonium]|uniref:Uncharacterized protein n=1 Tax=Datura stramonium TaxID=4076 RepID=A0ABS8WI32_DATST|nr:hypothetical protein [Datura stramonium]